MMEYDHNCDCSTTSISESLMQLQLLQLCTLPLWKTSKNLQCQQLLTRSTCTTVTIIYLSLIKQWTCSASETKTSLQNLREQRCWGAQCKTFGMKSQEGMRGVLGPAVRQAAMASPTAVLWNMASPPRLLIEESLSSIPYPSYMLSL